jgi:hypothetical protein
MTQTTQDTQSITTLRQAKRDLEVWLDLYQDYQDYGATKLVISARSRVRRHIEELEADR